MQDYISQPGILLTSRALMDKGRKTVGYFYYDMKGRQILDKFQIILLLIMKTHGNFFMAHFLCKDKSLVL